MAEQNIDFIAELEWRGLVSQMTSPDDLREHLATGARTVYCGFDPTADSLHIGSLVPLLVLRRAQLAGLKPILLLGGATGLIGDPSFKAVERSLNSEDIVAQWVNKLKVQVAPFIEFDIGSNSAVLANNLEWTQDLDVLTFLRDVGKHFSINAMINKESVKQRIDRDGEGISFTEFTYMILQSFDFAELNKRHGCTLQVGGSDQWGNITGGIELTRRMNKEQVFGLTLPLVTKSDGTKFGKTETGTIWLDAKKTSPYAFYQFWLNTADDDVYQFLRYFTFLSQEEVEVVEREDESAQGRRSAQGLLAQNVTEMVHGESGVEAAKRISQALFSGDLDQLTESDMAQLALDGLPSSKIAERERGLLQVLVDTGLAVTPRGEVTVGQARKFIQSNAVSVNGEKVTESEALLTTSTAYYGRFHILKRGKKNFHLLEWI